MAMYCSFHWAIIYLVLYLEPFLQVESIVYIVILAQPIVWRKISYWLRLVIVLWLKPMMPRRNRGPPVNVHTWLCYLAHAGITVSSHNPLWDYIDMLFLHKLFLPREIYYWCQFGNGVMIKDLWCRSETESPLWMYTQGYAAWRMLVSRSLVMIHYGTTLIYYLPWISSLKQFLCCLSKWSSNICHLYRIKRAYHFHVWSLFLDLSSDYTSKFPLHPLCKGEALKLFSIGRQLISSQMEICFTCCWDAGVCSFALLFNPCIPEPTPFISHEETDEQLDQMDFYPNEWSLVN
jgi:hypothetical protein